MRTKSRELLAVGIFGNKSKTGDRIEMLLRRGRTFSPRASVVGVAASAFVLGALTLAGSLAPRWIAFAQQTARPSFDEFEVATIKPAAPGSGRWIRMLSTNRLFAKNHTLKSLIESAYNLTPRAISGGPLWINSESFDILAETPGKVRPTLDEQMAMLRQLLTARFKLAFHRETREFSVYALTVGRNGPILKQSAAPDELPKLTNVVYPDHISLPARSATMTQFASMLQRSVLDRPVVDKTGLSGKYDFDLEWADDEGQFGGLLRKRASAEDGNDKPGLFAALQRQLGLGLQSTRGPVEVLVIDHVEKPDAN